MAKLKKPIIINLPITEVCDSQCIMCNVWRSGKTDEFTGSEIRSIFSQTLYSKVKHVGISGGEPTINNEIVNICTALTEVLPKIKTLSITSHGFHTEKLAELLPKIKNLCDNKGVQFSLNLSVDGYKEVHDKVRRIANGFNRVINSSKIAKSYGIHVQLQCTISPFNVYNVVRLREYAIKNNYEIIFRIATYIARLSNGDLNERIQLSFKQKSFVADFLDSPRTVFATNSLGRRLFYKDLSHRLRTGDERRAPCSFKSNALFVSPEKKIFNCSRSEVSLELHDVNNVGDEIFNSKNEKILADLKENTCTNCYHDQSGRWPLYKYFEVHNLFSKYLLKTNKISRLLTLSSEFLKASFFKRNIFIPQALGKVLIVGCYGGEHVGDAAILGGVIMRLNSNFSVRQFTIVSIRKDRTKTWVDNLNMPNISIDVISVDEKFKPSQYDALVLAGGPLMGIPTLLLNHIKYINIFKLYNKPFIVEGIGVGPHKEIFSKILIRKILNSSDIISVRSKNDKQSLTRIGAKVDAVVVKDPAFDYLSFINSKDLELPYTLRRILDTKKKIVVINLRPLWSKYSSNKADLALLQSDVIEALVNVMSSLGNKYRFVFLPMNADQFGFSDLQVAYDLEQQLDKLETKIDFHIWEYEPTIEEAVYLLKTSSLCISMRFHACIFSLSNNIPTIGLDYSIGNNGKVYNLFEGVDSTKNVINITEIDSNILLETAKSLLNEKTQS